MNVRPLVVAIAFLIPSGLEAEEPAKAAVASNPTPGEVPAAVAPAVATPAAAAPAAAAEPFAWADFTWLNGNNRQKAALLDSKYFTGQFTADVNWVYDFNHPIDHTIVGSTATFRANEFNLSFLGFGGDFHYDNVRGRLMTQFGTRATGIARNDASADRGQFDLRDALRYVSEAYGGYHWDILNGINLDAGIFMSYVGLFSYSNFENWAYQPSYTSDNTPWFFNGARLQVFPSDRTKLELWVVNGWQTYAGFNTAPGIGFQYLYRPQEAISIVANGYVGSDTTPINRAYDAASRIRFHSDNSLQIRYFNNPGKFFHRAAVSLTADLGLESGAGVQPFGNGIFGTVGNGNAGRKDSSGNALAPTCGGALLGAPGTPDCTQNFMAAMLYHRMWFMNDLIGWTVGGGVMHNPGRYLVLPPTGAANPYNAANANAFTLNAGDQFDAWDASTTVQIMPNEYVTWVIELVHRHTFDNLNYFAGRGGVTSATGYYPSNVQSYGDPNYLPDLRNAETRINLSMLVHF